jgi:hypothetical protein
MNSVKVPPVSSNGVGHGHDDLGDALRAFFRSEMPQPWPKLKLPTQERVIAPFPPPTASKKSWPRRWLFNSRTALAAALGVLIVGQLLLSNTLNPKAIDPLDDKRVDPSAVRPVKDPGKGILDKRPAPDPEDPDVILDESLIQDGNGPTSMKIKITPKKRG